MSAQMMRAARTRKIYDQLVLGDYERYLGERRARCDLVLAADVFIYAGDLVAVFEAVARLLRGDGLFAFSVEAASEGDYVLQPNRRYAHSLSYIRRLTRAGDLHEVAVDSVTLRRQGAEHAAGRIVVLRSNRSDV